MIIGPFQITWIQHQRPKELYFFKKVCFYRTSSFLATFLNKYFGCGSVSPVGIAEEQTTIYFFFFIWLSWIKCVFKITFCFSSKNFRLSNVLNLLIIYCFILPFCYFARILNGELSPSKIAQLNPWVCNFGRMDFCWLVTFSSPSSSSKGSFFEK